jgi:hypothetical protein
MPGPIELMLLALALGLIALIRAVISVIAQERELRHPPPPKPRLLPSMQADTSKDTRIRTCPTCGARYRPANFPNGAHCSREGR